MKVLFAAISLMLFLLSPIDGQKLVDPDNTWNIADCSQSGPECWTYRYKFDEDSTLIRGKYYHELLRSNEKSGNNWNTTSDYMWEKNNQIWYIDKYRPNIETLLYDFNLVIGDTFIINGYEDYKAKLYVKKVDSVEYGKILRKRITLYSTNNEFYKMQWVEGIGDAEFWLGPKWADVIDGGEGWLLCYDYKDETIYKVKEHEDCWYTHTSTDDNNRLNSISIYPNPTTDFINLNTNVDIEEIILYDQFRNRILSFSSLEEMNISMLQAGVYFVQIKTDKGSYYYDKIIKL